MDSKEEEQTTLYKVDEKSNRITPLSETEFREQGKKERVHLQEWICHAVECLNDEKELLIVQKEFNSFDKTNERLDLLALDSEGSLVVIENKRDDSGSNVTWQALKYASFVSKMNFDELCAIYADYLNKNDTSGETAESAKRKLLGFLEIEEAKIEESFNHKQRIILVAHRFRQEVISTALWLLDRGIDIRCVEAVPYADGSELLIDFNTLVPSPTLERIGIRQGQDATPEERGRSKLYRTFWAQLLERIGKAGEITLQPRSYMPIIPFCSFCFSSNGPRIDAYIDKFDKAGNEAVFDRLFAEKDKIENAFGEKLSWERLEMKNACRIAYYFGNSSITDTNQWPSLIESMARCWKKFADAVSAKVVAAVQAERNKR